MSPSPSICSNSLTSSNPLLELTSLLESLEFGVCRLEPPLSHPWANIRWFIRASHQHSKLVLGNNGLETLHPKDSLAPDMVISPPVQEHLSRDQMVKSNDPRNILQTKKALFRFGLFQATQLTKLPTNFLEMQFQVWTVPLNWTSEFLAFGYSQTPNSLSPKTVLTYWCKLDSCSSQTAELCTSTFLSSTLQTWNQMHKTDATST